MKNKVLQIVAVLAVIAALGAAYWFWLKPQGNLPVSTGPIASSTAQAVTLTPNNVQAYRDYKDDDVSLQYPAWTDLAGRIDLPENTKIAVSNGTDCTFVLNQYLVPQNQTLKSFIDDLLANSDNKTVKVIKKEVTNNSVVVQEEINNQGVAIFSTAQGYMDSGHRLFVANFIGLKMDFDKQCLPYAKTVFGSIKLAH